MKRALLCLLAGALTASVARADTVLSGALTADNQFNAYLSTSPTTIGTLIAGNLSEPVDLSVEYWATALPITAQTLSPGTTYYLQIVAVNWPDPGAGYGENPGAILGSFYLSNADFEFANGAQTLNTNTTIWTYSYNSFGYAALTPSSEGANGVGPWGTIAGIDAGAEWIWDSNFYYPFTASDPTDPVPSNGGDGDLFFETEIIPTPEPVSLALLGTGLLALGGMAARRRRRA
jgi:hypothetical protein